MKKLAIIMLLGFAGTSHASLELAQKNNCLACHSVDKKVVGPAYKDVASKYASKKDAAPYLVSKIKNGSTGVWGQIPMPPNTQVSEADARKLAEWILKLK
jgi:cytochrome c